MNDRNNCHLLFFDTFAHDGTEGLKLDLVQFPTPIVIDEIRVIPLGARVEADFAGGVRLGATNPSTFELQFFVNDLSKRDACTFSDIGSFEYKQNVNIKFEPHLSIPTDGLILRGMYSTLTLAIFGTVADINSLIAHENSQTSAPISHDQIIDDFRSATSADDIIHSHNDFVTMPLPSTENVDVKSVLSERHDSDDFKEKLSPTPFSTRRIGSRASSNSSEGIKSDRKRRRNSRERDRYLSREANKDYFRKDRSRSPASSVLSKSRSRSGTPSSLKRHYSRVTPLSPRRRSRTPPKSRIPPRRARTSRSQSPRTLQARRILSPVSPQSRSLSSSRRRSPFSPVVISNQENREELGKVEEINVNKPTSSIFSDADLFEPLSPEQTSSKEGSKEGGLLDNVEGISDEENLGMSDDEPVPVPEQEVVETKSKDFEEISSEEEYEEDANAEDDLDFNEFGSLDNLNAWNVNPFEYDFTPLIYFKDPSLTHVEKLESDEIFDEEKENKILDYMKSFKEQELNEKWVESVEELCNEISEVVLKNDETWSYLIPLIEAGLDFEKAVKQPQTAYKVRHLKAGIKLFIALCQTNEDAINRLCKNDLIKTLIQLFDKPAMTLPVKLLIVRAVDVFSNSVFGTQHFITKIYQWSENENLTCYQKLLTIFISNPSTRLIIALKTRFKKFDFYETLSVFEEECKNLNTSSDDALYICLASIQEIYRDAQNLLAHPVRYLPANNKFDGKISPFNCYLSVYKYFNHFHVLEHLTTILTYQQLHSSDVIQIAIEILNDFGLYGHGLHFLLSPQNFKFTLQCLNQLQILLQTEDENLPLANALKLSYQLVVCQIVDILSGNSLDLNSPFEELREKCEEVSRCMYRLYVLLFIPYAREALLKVLSSDQNLNSILHFISFDKKADTQLFKPSFLNYVTELILNVVEGNDNIIPFFEQNSLFLLKLAESELHPKLKILSNWLSPIKNGVPKSYEEATFVSLMKSLKKYCENESTETTTFLMTPELITTMKNLKYLCLVNPGCNADCDDTGKELKHQYGIVQIFLNDGLSLMLGILQNLQETFLKPNQLNYLGNQGNQVVILIDCVLYLIKAMLKSLVIARGNEFKDTSSITTLLRTYALLANFPSRSCHENLTQKLQEEVINTLLIFTELCLSATESEEAFSKSVWTKMVQETISFTLSSPMFFVPGLNILFELLPLPLPIQVKEPILAEEATKIVNSRKLWSAHLHLVASDIEKLVVSLTASSSNTVQLLLRRVCVQLSDLSSPTATVIAKSVMENLFEVLSTGTPHETVPKQFIRMLNLLSDLSCHPPFKVTLLSVVQSNNKKDDRCHQSFMGLLNLLNKSSENISHLSCQDFILSVLQPLCDPEISLISAESNLDVFNNASPPKELMISIIQDLIQHIDPTLNHSLTTVTGAIRILTLISEQDFGIWHIKLFLTEKYPDLLYSLLSRLREGLAQNCYKTLEIIQISCALLDFFKVLTADGEMPFVTTRSLNFTFANLQKILKWTQEQSEINKCGSPYQKLEIKLQEVNVESSELVLTQSQATKQEESISITESTDKENENEEDTKTELIKSEYIDNVSPEKPGNFEPSSEGDRDIDFTLHPLTVLERKLIVLRNESPLEFEGFEGTFEYFKRFLQSLKMCTSETQVKESFSMEPNLVASEPITTLFAHRQVFVVVDQVDEEKLSSSYWFTISSDENNHYFDQNGEVKTNLMTLAHKYCGSDFDFRAALEKVRNITSANEVQSIKEEETVSQKRRPLISSGIKGNQLNLTKRMSNAIRGRGGGFTRPFSRGNDPFRSRPPNTSRPPSMHVDDFVAMESEPGGMSMPGKRFGKEFGRGRNSSNSSTRPFGVSNRSYYGSGSGLSYDRRPSPSQNSANSRSNRYSLSSKELYSNRSSTSQSSQRWNKSGNNGRQHDSRYSRTFSR